MTIKATLTRLEAKPGGKPIKHYLWVRARYGETKEAAIERYLQERGITYAHQEDLIGYFDARRAFQAYLDAENGQSLGPPSERPGFEESIRRYEEIETR